MVKISYTGSYREQLKQLMLKTPETRILVDQYVDRFAKNPEDTRLDNHPLTKSLEGTWAFSITNDVRIIYEWVGKSTVRFLAIGGHQKVYSRSKPRTN